ALGDGRVDVGVPGRPRPGSGRRLPPDRDRPVASEVLRAARDLFAREPRRVVRARRQHDLGADRQGARLLLAQLADPEPTGGVADPLDRGGALRRAARGADPGAHHEAAEQADAELRAVPIVAVAVCGVTLRAPAG